MHLDLKPWRTGVQPVLQIWEVCHQVEEDHHQVEVDLQGDPVDHQVEVCHKVDLEDQVDHQEEEWVAQEVQAVQVDQVAPQIGDLQIICLQAVQVGSPKIKDPELATCLVTITHLVVNEAESRY